MKSRHISRKRLVFYLLNELSDKERQAVGQHINTCSECAERFQAEKTVIMHLLVEPKPEPNEKVLDRCRKRLAKSLKKESEQVKHTISFSNILENLIFPTPVTRLASIAVIFVAGLIIGNRLTFHNQPSDVSGWKAVSALKSASPAGNIHIVPIKDKPGRIEIRFRAVEDKIITGDIRDPHIQYALTYALVNEPRDNIRLKTVELLRETSHDEVVQDALIHALKNDGNPGVRLKAIKILKNLPVSYSIKQILLYAFFKDPNSGIRTEAVNALSRIEDPDIQPMLRKKAQEDDYVKAIISRTANEQSQKTTRKM